jgi:filamentous hemagglutinin family protein
VQSTPKTSINWQSFSIGPTETVRFIQPSSSAIILNRVIGPDASSIMGSISANGRVFLINPSGILFGKGSQVNVGGLVASTQAISDANFLAGKYIFNGTSTAAITNLGNISTNGDGGYIALLGANVTNNGLISARLGTIAMAAGNAITLDLAGDQLLKVTIDQGALDALVSNGNLVIADGGQVLMTAKGAGTLLSNSVNNTGVIQAQSIENINGVIILAAGPQAGISNVSGLLDVSGVKTGQTGGSVEVLGHTVNLSNATINASGDAGGGSVLIGGNFKGAGPQPNSLYTNMDSQSSIHADALKTGNGGRIALWSDGTSTVAGTLSAKGGSSSGDGGFIETSGKQLILASTSSVNTLAAYGKTGTWLLDPINWTIATVGGDETPASVALSLASSDRIIEATNDITVTNAITWSTSQDLTLNAGHDININAAITASTAGARLNMTAGNDVVIASPITASGLGNQINVTSTNGNITATGAITASESGTQLNMTSGQDLVVGTVTTAGGGSMTLRAKRDITVDTATTAAGVGTVSLYADNDGTGPGVAGGTVNIGSGGISANNTIIRFNPTTYTNTTTEVNAYVTKIVGLNDIKAWVFTQANNKVYDQSTTATLIFKGTPTGASAVTLNSGTATFNNKNVGDGKAVDYSGYSLGGTATNLALFASSGTTTANITPATLAVSATGTNKVYDGNTSDAVTLSATPISGDTVALGNTAANFIDKNVGTAKTVNVTGISLSGADAANYTANTTTTTTANITAAPLTVSATGNNKVYDGTTSDTVTLRSNAFSGDVVTLSNTAANFENSSIGINKTVSVTGITTSGADAGNYTANTTATTTASITTGVASADSNSNSNSPFVVPVTPTEINAQSPLALREDIQRGTSTPLNEFGANGGSGSNSNDGSIIGIAGTPILAGVLASNQTALLTVTQMQKEPEMLSLFPVATTPLVAPIPQPIPQATPLLILPPKQGRN